MGQLGDRQKFILSCCKYWGTHAQYAFWYKLEKKIVLSLIRVHQKKKKERKKPNPFQHYECLRNIYLETTCICCSFRKYRGSVDHLGGNIMLFGLISVLALIKNCYHQRLAEDNRLTQESLSQVEKMTILYSPSPMKNRVFFTKILFKIFFYQKTISAATF